VILNGLVTRSNRPVEGAYVRLIGPSGDFTAEVRTGASGVFTFHPHAGRWEIRALLPGGANFSRSVMVGEGETLGVELKVDDGAGTGSTPLG
jgi:hypothetical protein